MDRWNNIVISFSSPAPLKSRHDLCQFEFDIFCAIPYLRRMSAVETPAPGLREQKKAEARERTLDAFIALLVDGAADLSHDAVAARAGVARRTVYRYFPDREAMMQAALLRVRSLAGPKVAAPTSVEDILTSLEAVYTGFDKIAPIVIMIRSTPQGRALRKSQNAERLASYTGSLAEAVKALPPADRKLATAMIAVLHTTPWLEMRDHWGLDGRQIARATGWAIRTLLADLERRGCRPLDEDVEA
jgi:AcrR family transcriptional regulator